MIYKEVRLKELYPSLTDVGGDPTLKVYARSNTAEIQIDRLYPAVLICPGGGYAFVSDREAEPVALQYLRAGYNAFVLTYSVAPAKYPAALLQAAAAMDYIKKTANVTNTDPDRVAVCGFSAGGHLAGSLGCFWHDGLLADTLECDSANFKPAAMVLCYPVITGGIKSHYGSFDNLCGDDAKLRQKMSLETAVTEDTPPAFIWHTWDDGCVPVENSLMMAEALKKSGIECELHIFRSGSHGLSTCDELTAPPAKANKLNPRCAVWLDLSVGFLGAAMK